MRSLSLFTLALLTSSVAAQFSYDFDQLNGSDPHPFTMLDGQDNWSEETFNAPNRCGVTATLSHDGSQCLRFEEVGPGYGCDASRINDGFWLFAPFGGTERTAMFQADVQVGFWGGSFGLAHDTNGDTTIRGSQAGELGVRFTVGTNANIGLRLHGADGTLLNAPLTGIASGGEWLRVRVVMDLSGHGGLGAGSMFVQNITQGDAGFRAVPGLQDVPLGLDQTASDARNPTLWDAVWLHFEGATYALDNIEIGWAGFARPFGTACSGASGPVELVANGTFQFGTQPVFESNNHEPNSIGIAVYGISTTTWNGVPLPVSIDPILGTSGCTLYTDLLVAVTVPTSATAPAVMSHTFPIPQFLTEFRFYLQHACLEPVPGGWSLSNALEVQYP